MATVRGSAVLNTIAFVRDTLGIQAHRRILALLPPDHAAGVDLTMSEGQRRPLEYLVAYMEQAKALFAPTDDDFYRAMGRFGGVRNRDDSNFRFMLQDRETAIRMAKVLWTASFDEGSLETVSSTPTGATLRVIGFRCAPSLCQRILGTMEVELRASGDHTACVFRGDAHCEYALSWEAEASGRGAEP